MALEDTNEVPFTSHSSYGDCDDDDNESTIMCKLLENGYATFMCGEHRP